MSDAIAEVEEASESPACGNGYGKDLSPNQHHHADDRDQAAGVHVARFRHKACLGAESSAPTRRGVARLIRAAQPHGPRTGFGSGEPGLIERQPAPRSPAERRADPSLSAEPASPGC